jgi:hypothetical protein
LFSYAAATMRTMTRRVQWRVQYREHGGQPGSNIVSKAAPAVSKGARKAQKTRSLPILRAFLGVPKVLQTVWKLHSRAGPN